MFECLFRWSAVVALFVACAGAHAHGIWFAERSGQMALVYGHGAEDLDMIRRHEKVREVAGYDASGAPVPVTLRKTDHLLLVDAKPLPAVITAVLDNGYWSKGPDGKWVNKGRDEVTGAEESGRYVKYAVFMRESLKAPLKPLPGQVLQIVPLKATLPHHKDDSMTVRVLFNGKPVAGAKVTRDYVGDPEAKPLVTGKDGTVTLRVRNDGLNVITAAYDAPPDDPAKATKTGLFASLAFAITHKAH
jgi:nickel transport protein